MFPEQRPAEFHAVARYFLLGKGDMQQAAAIAEAQRAPERVQRILKSAVAAGDLADPSWGGNLADYRVAANGFAEALRSISAFDAMLPSMRRVPLNTRVGAVTAAVAASAEIPGKARAVSTLQLAGRTLQAKRCCAFTVVTEELIRWGNNAEGLIGGELQAGVASGTNTEFFNAILDSITPASSSGDAVQDLRVLFSQLVYGARAKLFLVSTAAVSKQLSLLQDIAGAFLFPDLGPTGGTIKGTPFLVSDEVGAGNVVAVDASQIAGASETVTLALSNAATIEMESAPTGASTSQDSPPAPTATSLVSMWQTNSVALRADRFFGCERLRDTAVAVIENAEYGVGSPAI